MTKFGSRTAVTLGIIIIMRTVRNATGHDPAAVSGISLKLCPN